ncbi:DUF559 domain-containing protein [Microbacterium telephonicum]|uniref:Uncharacterized protein DUF559 n=1 Tax=Microbacterium telephonicum TaxID=1714841 RepID=A0A498CAY8_9MICO|nr:DUF559 domain-containing protein [Microbacterium telephonicum]RLK52417.1 uncharacterized protein DUF559 [Microbacterium telephonicum]
MVRDLGTLSGMTAAELPASLGSVFTVADAAAAGVARSRLRARDLRTPYRGVRITGGHPLFAPAGDPDHEARRAAMLARAAALRGVMTETQFFTHAAAAVIWGFPLPAWLLADARPLDVGVFAPLRHPRRLGVAGHQVLPGHAHVTRHPVSGVQVTTPASTWVMLGAHLGVWDLVAAGDFVVREPMFGGDDGSLATIAQLECLAGAGRRVGVKRLREALPLIRTRSASATETRCRLVLTGAGLPEPQLNHELRDPSGMLLAVLDLAYPERRVAVEYEGAHHLLDSVQWSKDITRYEMLAALGWTVIRVTSAQLHGDAAGVVARVRRALAARPDAASPVTFGDVRRPRVTTTDW